MRSVPLTLLALPILSVVASAQQEVVLRGEIEDAPGAGAFVLDFTDVALTSNTLNLNAFADQKVELTGTWNGSTQSPSVLVTAVTPSSENFEIGEQLRIGQESYLALSGTPGALGFGFLSLGQGFLPTSAGDVVLIDPAQVVLSVSGTLPGSGEREFGFGVPNNPALVGVELFAQGALFAGGAFELTNPYADTITF